MNGVARYATSFMPAPSGVCLHRMERIVLKYSVQLRSPARAAVSIAGHPSTNLARPVSKRIHSTRFASARSWKSSCLTGRPIFTRYDLGSQREARRSLCIFACSRDRRVLFSITRERLLCLQPGLSRFVVEFAATYSKLATLYSQVCAVKKVRARCAAVR